jgi:ribose 5-phosphate isomerase B
MAMLVTMRVYLGSDHAGFELKVSFVKWSGPTGRLTTLIKAFLVQHLTSLEHDVVDVGPAVFDPDDDDYPPFCVETARRVVADAGSLGVVIGGSGNGEQIAANKVRGCRAALAWSTETARLARKHNDAQVVAGAGKGGHPGDETAAQPGRRCHPGTPFPTDALTTLFQGKILDDLSLWVAVVDVKASPGGRRKGPRLWAPRLRPTRFGRGSPGPTRLFLTGTAPDGLPRSPRVRSAHIVVAGLATGHEVRESRNKGEGAQVIMMVRRGGLRNTGD